MIQLFAFLSLKRSRIGIGSMKILVARLLKNVAISLI